MSKNEFRTQTDIISVINYINQFDAFAKKLKDPKIEQRVYKNIARNLARRAELEMDAYALANKNKGNPLWHVYKLDRGKSNAGKPYSKLFDVKYEESAKSPRLIYILEEDKVTSASWIPLEPDWRKNRGSKIRRLYAFKNRPVKWEEGKKERVTPRVKVDGAVLVGSGTKAGQNRRDYDNQRYRRISQIPFQRPGLKTPNFYKYKIRRFNVKGADNNRPYARMSGVKGRRAEMVEQYNTKGQFRKATEIVAQTLEHHLTEAALRVTLQELRDWSKATNLKRSSMQLFYAGDNIPKIEAIKKHHEQQAIKIIDSISKGIGVKIKK